MTERQWSDVEPIVYVIVALTPHEARLLVMAIDDAAGVLPGTGDPMMFPLRGVRDDIMKGLSNLTKSNLAKSRPELQSGAGEA